MKCGEYTTHRRPVLAYIVVGIRQVDRRMRRAQLPYYHRGRVRSIVRVFFVFFLFRFCTEYTTDV